MTTVNYSTGTIHSRVFDLKHRKFGHVQRQVIYGFGEICRQVEFTVELDDGMIVRRWADEIASADNLAAFPGSFTVMPPCDAEYPGPEAA